MNELVDLVNRKIKEEVSKAGDHVHFLNWDDDAANMGGQFCRKEVKEPDTNRWDAGFYQFDSRAPLSKRSTEEVVPGSIEGLWNGLAGAAFELGGIYKGNKANDGSGGIKKRSIFTPDTIG
jgi:hypothetical protein